MAQATSTREVVTVTLVLTYDEARAVKALVGNVVGEGKWRSLANEIWDALEAVMPEAGVPAASTIRFFEDDHG